MVEEPPAATEAGLNETVTPAGWPLALIATLCAAPVVTAVAIVDAPLDPCATVTDAGDAEMEKSEPTTLSVTAVVCVPLEPVPVIVIVYVPGAVDAPTLTVIVDEPPALTDVGLKETVVPAGWPLALRLTDCVPPVVTAVAIEPVALPACPIVRLVGFAESEKSDGPLVQDGNLNEPTRVCQLKLPLPARYSPVYQKVQSSAGSTLMLV